MVRKIRQALALIIVIPASIIYVFLFVIIGCITALPSMLKALRNKMKT